MSGNLVSIKCLANNMEDVLILSDDRKTIEGVKDTSITHVTVPEGIEIIGTDSFNGCKSLQRRKTETGTLGAVLCMIQV